MFRSSITIIVCFILLPLGNISAQCAFKFSGKLTDIDDAEPLPYASVYIAETGQGTVSSEDGSFLIENLCAGIYTVKIKHILCADITDTIILSGNTIKNYAINHQDNELETVIIHTEKHAYTGTSNSDNLDAREIELLTGKSLGETLKEINGLTSLQSGPSISKPVIHGLHSYRILILNNGVRQESQQWGSEHGPEIDPFIASNITVIKGAQSVKYGSDAIGGVILIDPARMPDTIGSTSVVNIVGMTNGFAGAGSAIIQGRFKNFNPLAWRLQGTFRRGGDAKTPNYYLANTAYREENFSVTFHYDKKNFESEVYYSFFDTKVGIFSASHIGNLTDLLVAFESDTPLIVNDFSYTIGRPHQLIQHHLLKSTSTINTKSAGFFDATIAYQNNYRSEYDSHLPLNDSLAALNLPTLYLEIGTITGNLEWRQPIKNNFYGSVGIDVMNQQNITRYSNFIPNFKSYAGGAYAIEKYVYNKFIFEVGLRYDYKWLQVYKYFNDFLNIIPYNFQNISWSAGTNYQATEALKLNFNIGSAWRAPSVSELYSSGLHHGAASLEYGDPNLKKEEAIDIEIGIHFSNKKWDIDAGVYNNSIHNFIYLQPTLPPQLTIRGAFPVFYYKQTDANLFGFDITTKYHFPFRLQAEVKASVLRARDMINDTWIVQMPADRIGGSLQYSFRNKEKFQNFFISINTQHVFEQTRVQADEDYVPQPPAYTLFGLQTGSDWRINHSTITWSIEGENIFNAEYRDYLNRFRYFSDDVGRNITLRFKIPFTF